MSYLDISRGKHILDEKNVATEKFYAVKKKLQLLESKIQLSKFEYTSPTPDFDRSKVKGPIAYLFRVKEKYKTASYALEVCAGSRLYDVSIIDCFASA